ncbi:MAG: MBL fold metallo-hydrolase [Leptolinea sp.]|jgi:metallo-beta-lactamase family protein|nr:MBL fold metallo-hydrolase [Leptolinea sp.]
MKIHFYGAAQTVTGSKYLLEINGKQLLLECGFFQGKRADSYDKNQKFPFDPRNIDAMILSHAHIDHSGNLPNLVKNGYAGPIYATPATALLADIMLQDSGHIQEYDVEYLNKKRAKKGEPPVEPIYTQEDAKRVAQYFVTREYNREFSPLPGVTAHLVDAGHILGSAAIVLDIQENGKPYRFWFSGDIGRDKLPLLMDPVLPEHPDYLMMECTYGDKPHSDPEDAYREFREVVARTIKRGGKVIIPAFAVGRTQEIVYSLNRMFSNHELKPVPVFVDSPLAVSASKIFREHSEYFDDETQKFIHQGNHPALDFPLLTYIQSVEESKKLNERNDPMIIISASGMAENGRILHHLKNNIEEPRNTITIVGWQAPYTLGRRLADREVNVKIFGEEYHRKAEVATIGGLSAHAGQEMLVKYARAAGPAVKKIILVHGEQDAESKLVEKFKENNFAPVTYPVEGEAMELG